MLTLIPDDVLSTILCYLPNNKKRLFNTAILLPEYERNNIKSRQQFASNQIKLYIKVSYLAKLQISTINMYIATYFTACHSRGRFKKYKGECLMYAPFIPYGMCRFCSDYRNKHKYVKMIDTYRTLKCLI